MKKRIISLLLCLCMVFSLLPTAVLAADGEDPDTSAGSGQVTQQDSEKPGDQEDLGDLKNSEDSDDLKDSEDSDDSDALQLLGEGLGSELSGNCGATEADHVTWELTDDDGDGSYTLTISGNGAMKDYTSQAGETVTDPTEWYALKDSITEIKIEEGVTGLGNWAFSYLTNVVKANIPASITSLGDHIFRGDTALTTVEWASGFNAPEITDTDSKDNNYSGKYVPTSMFDGCTSLGSGKELSAWLPASFTGVGCAAFRGTQFTVDFGDWSNLTYIGAYGFAGMPNLDSFTLSNEIRLGLRGGASNAFNSSGLRSLTVADEISAIPSGLCNGCEQLSSVALADLVTTIATNAFFNTKALKEIDLKNVQTINSYAFWGSGLTALVLPKSVKTVESRAFEACTSLTKVTINAAELTLNNSNTFAGCSSLNTVVTSADSKINLLNASAFGPDSHGSYVQAPVENIEINGTVDTLNFSTLASLKSLKINGKNTWYGNILPSGFENLVINGDNWNISGYQFAGKTPIKHFVVSAAEVSDNADNEGKTEAAFRSNFNLETAQFTGKTVKLQAKMFLGCTNLKWLDLSAVDTLRVGSGCFGDDNNENYEVVPGEPNKFNEDCVIYAKDAAAAQTLRSNLGKKGIVLIVNGGTVDVTAATAGFGAVSCEGFTAQWYETEDFSGTPYTGTPEKGKTYYAKWIEHIPERPIIHYVLVQDFNYKGTGSTTWTQTASTATNPYKFNVSTGQDGDPKRENYKFLGWADEPTAKAAKYQAGDEIWLTGENPTKTIYAVWTPCNHSYGWVDNGDGTHSEKCTECGHKKDEKKDHYDNDGNGKCDACGADMPTPPTDVPELPGEKEKIAGIFYFTCETEVQHYVKTNYEVALQTRNGYTILNREQGAQKDEKGYYFDLQVDATPYLSEYNTQSGKEHTICEGETNPFTIRFHYVEKVWVQDTKPTVKVECNGTQPETPPTKPGVLEGGVTFECENPDKTHTVFYSTTYTIQAKDYTFINDVQYDDETKQYYVLANVTLDSEYYLELFDGWTGATHRISDGQSLTLTGIRFNYEKSTAPGGVASWKQELPKPVIRVTCAEELIPVELVIYRNGDTSESYKTVRVANVKKGTVIKAADYPIGKYYDGTNSGGKYDFYGWYDDGLWNIYKRDPANPPAGLTEKTVNGWTNFKCMVYDYENVVYYMSDADRVADNRLFATTARKGAALPTADAPTATRPGYTFKFWSREGQSTDVSGQKVNGWTNLVANWEKIPDPTKENIEFNGKDTVYVKCDIYGTHAEPIAYGNGEYEIVRTSDTTANLVFTSATYLAASKYANDHALAAVSDPEVSTQIEFKDGKWQQLKNGPTVHVLCKVTLTYDANAPEGKPVTNMPDPLKVTQTLNAGSTTTFYLSENIPACKGYVFLGWTSDTTLDVPTIPVEWKTENNGANWKTTTGYPGYTLYAVWQKITTPDVNEIDFSGKQIYVKCAIYDGAHGEFIDYIPGSYRIDWDGVSPKANLVFTAQSYLDASMFAGDHVLTNATQTEVSTQIVFENGQWTQKTNGPTVQVSCQAALTYNANEPAGTASNMPDPNPVKQTLTDKATKMTVIALSNKTPSLKGYKFLGWATTADAATPDYPVGDMTDAAKWSITVGYEGKTLYAVWARTYSIYYDGNGGTFTKGGKDFTHVSDNDLTLGEPHTLRENVFTREHYEFTGWAKTKEGPKDYDGGATDVTFAESDLNGKGQVRLYAQWKPVEVDVNVYITPVDSGEEDSLLVNDVKLNAATLARIGLKAYETDEDGEAIDRILVGKYASKIAAGLTEDLFGDKITTDVTDELSGFQKDADIPDAFNTNNILSNTTWTWLSVEDEENFLSGNLPLYTVRFVTEDEANVKNMPTALYSYNGAPIYDYYLKGEKVAAPTIDPSRTGYTFKGWYAPDATDKFVFTEDTVTGDLVLTAKWEPEIYTITYEYNDKDIKNKKELQPKNPNSYTIEDAITLNDITAAGEHGKQFVEWRCDLNKDGVAETITEIPKGTTGNLTISAHWNYPVNYTVFDKNGDKIDSLSKTEYVFEDVLNSKDGYKLTALTKDGYTFDGWYQDDADLGKTEKLIKDQTLKGAKKWELYANWTANTYKVTFDPKGGEVNPREKNVTFDAAYGELPTPTRTGYTFKGWYLSKTEFTDANKVEATTIVKTPGDHMLYANWTANTYTVTFNPNADDATVAPTSKLVTFDAAYGELPTPTRENYRFVGWYLNGVRVTKDTIVKTAANHTLLAGWSRSYYALTINYVDRNGKKLEKSYEASVALGADFSVPSPKIKGYKLRDKDDAVIEGTMTAEGYTYDVVYIKKSSGGSSVQIESPNKPKQDNSLKFNTEDHFAYVNGYPDGTVKPTGDVTRAEVAAILYRVMDADCVKTYETTRCSFSDVVRGDWFNLYVATLENAGVIVDTGTNGKFRPNEAITRAELAAMLAQFADIKSAANSFNDVSARHWASDEIAVCAKMGWINGYPDGSFRPDATITRAEMMAMINRALGRTPKSADDLLSGMKTWRDNANVNAWYYLDVQEATNSHTYTKSGTHETWKKLR